MCETRNRLCTLPRYDFYYVPERGRATAGHYGRQEAPSEWRSSGGKLGRLEWPKAARQRRFRQVPAARWHLVSDHTFEPKFEGVARALAEVIVDGPRGR